MEKELLTFISENDLNPFNRTRTTVRSSNRSIYKTKDAKDVHASVLDSIAKHFVFPDTSNLLKFFDFADDFMVIRKRQEFFSAIPKNLASEYLKQLKAPKATWKPPYSIVVVTEDGDIYNELKELAVPVKLIISDNDIRDLESADIVQVVECGDYRLALEQLPQSVFVRSTDEIYLERFVSLLSGWVANLETLKQNNTGANIQKIISEIEPLIELTKEGKRERLTHDSINESLEMLNDSLMEEIKGMSISGDLLMKVLKGSLPPELKDIVHKKIASSNIPEALFNETLPLSLNEQEVERFLREQDLTSFTSVAERIKKHSAQLIRLPERLKSLEHELLLQDFVAGISRWMSGKNFFPLESPSFFIKDAQNMFLTDPQPISFNLDEQNKCSVLTGANSGGKTTLLEHIIQYLSCFQLGLPVAGEFRAPLFSEVYYFAKTKGSMSKGAFETLLTQMSTITPGDNTLILADEIEAVTEPGVAGKMIAATAEYFIQRGCYLVIATHLGEQIAKVKPERARIDGIEAKGLDEFNQLIVDHNPVLGRLASSTPELIVEKMAKVQGGDYFEHLHSYLKRSG